MKYLEWEICQKIYESKYSGSKNRNGTSSKFKLMLTEIIL